MKIDYYHLTLSILLALLMGFLSGGVFMANSLGVSHKLELNALQAQVDKKYCKGEVTYLELREEFLDDS